jgi:hypothetical protein
VKHSLDAVDIFLTSSGEVGRPQNTNDLLDLIFELLWVGESPFLSVSLILQFFCPLWWHAQYRFDLVQ